jgi:TatD DNase family protein
VGTPNIRFALGAHPLTTNKLNSLEWALFNRYLTDTSYIGEVGLDFSPDGVATRSDQEQTFRRVLSAVAGKHKVLTLHSRRAEATVAELLAEYAVGPAIFHWYSGSVSILDRILEAGHYLSFNPAMIRSKNGQRIIARVPADRVLVETDGPYTTVAGRPTTPQDVDVVYTYLAALQQQDVEAVISQVYRNFMSLLNVR